MKRKVVPTASNDVPSAGDSVSEPARAKKMRGETRAPDRPAKVTVEESGNGPPIKRSDGQVYGG